MSVVNEDPQVTQDILEPATPAPGAAIWPNAPAELDKVYGFTCPSTGAAMVAMLKESFVRFGTTMEGMRRVSEKLDLRVKELLAQQKELAHRFNDLAKRHQNLREVTRQERIAKLEDKIVLPESGGNVLRRIFHKR